MFMLELFEYFFQVTQNKLPLTLNINRNKILHSTHGIVAVKLSYIINYSRMTVSYPPSELAERESLYLEQDSLLSWPCNLSSLRILAEFYLNSSFWEEPSKLAPFRFSSV